MPRELSPKELHQQLDDGPSFFLLDVRAADEYEKSHIEVKKEIPKLNIPYYDLIEKGGKEDFKESIIQAINENFKTQLPKDKQIVVVCNRGRSALIVTDILAELGYHVSCLTGGMQGWRSFTEKKTIVDSPNLTIIQVIRTSRGCLSYVIVSDGMAAVIDPFRDTQPYLEIFKELNLKPQFILDTHAHADHISGGRALAEKLGVPYYLHPYDGIHPMDMLPAKFPYEPSWADRIFRLGKLELKALHVPGHTLGNQAFLLDNKYLFTGDSIFLGSIARPDLGGHAKEWTGLHYDSIRKLLELPDDTIVLPAHFNDSEEANENQNYSSTLGKLKKTNQGLMMAQKSLQEFTEYITNNLPKFPEEYIDIKRVNLGLLPADDELAAQLELGKNICAMKTP